MTKPTIKTTDGKEAFTGRRGSEVELNIDDLWFYFDPTNASRLAIQLRLAAIEVEGKPE